MAFNLDLHKLAIDKKYRVSPVGDKALKELFEVHLLHTSRFGKVGFRHWQPLYQVSSSTRSFMITGYHNEWTETVPLWHKLSQPTSDRLVAVMELTRDLGWFAIDPKRSHEIQFPAKKAQKIDVPAGILRALTEKPATYLEVKGKKLCLEYPAHVGLFGSGKQGQALADLCINLMLRHADLFAIGHVAPSASPHR